MTPSIMPRLSVIIPAHNPHAGRLRRTLSGLCSQTLPASDWETVLVDNASAPPLEIGALAGACPPNLRLVREPVPGLSHARQRGFEEARGDLFVLVDDDNVLDPSYLGRVVELFATHSRIGALGGPCRPEFERAPQAWQAEFFGLLALRDLGPAPLIAGLRQSEKDEQDTYPLCAPVGAGMALRRAAIQSWMDRADPASLTDRRGTTLTSGGDNDIVIHVLRAGWQVAYFPELELTHLIPDGRLKPDYLARLNRGIQKSWMQVLTLHDLNDWPPIPGWTVPLRQLKAWFTYRAWTGSPARIRWQGACGHFEGRATRTSTSASSEARE